MKIIIDTDLGTDNVTSVSASSEDASFPASNMLNDFTTDVWKANGLNEAIITVLVSKGSAIEILNTNALTAEIVIGTGGDYEAESGYSLETGYELETSYDPISIVQNLPGSKGRLWADYQEFSTPHIIRVTLTAEVGETVYAGILRAGNVETFNDPLYSPKEFSTDFSIEKELNNGADYFRVRNIVRSFPALSIIETRENAFKFKLDIFDQIGPKPLAIRLAHKKITDKEFVLFAKRISPPEVEYISSTLAKINFNLREVI